MTMIKRYRSGSAPFLGAALALAIGGSSAQAATTIQHVPRREVVTSGSVSSPQPTAVQIGSEIRESAEGDVADSADGAVSGSDGGTTGHRKRHHHQHGSHRSVWHKRRHGGGPLAVPLVSGSAVVPAPPALSFDGLNHFAQRFGSSDGNNAFSVEPPDQALCVGGDYVMEVVNVVLQVYRKDGTSVGPVLALNDLYGYAPEIDRSLAAGQPGRFGPSVTDPSCLYDAKNERWIVSVLTLETDSITGALTGENHLDLAVSKTADPTGPFNVYEVPVEDNGTFGQPDHHCTDGTVPNFCLGDYPHIGLDANGLYVTTNEFSVFSGEFTSAQLYAISRADLARGSSAIDVVHIDGLEAGGFPGFTVWPANSNEGDYADLHDGTEYFLSSTAVFQDSGIDNRIAVWSLNHTKSLDSSNPHLSLTNRVISTEAYAVPPSAKQKAGPTPLADCLNDVDCAPTLLGTADPFKEVEGPLDSNDSRMQEVWFVDGMLIGALDTAALVNGVEQAGIAWFTIDTRDDHAFLADQGYLGVAGNNVTYPATATLPNGRGVLAFTLVGDDYYPSAAFADLHVSRAHDHRAVTRIGSVRIAGLGVGPEDGLSEYQVFNTDADGNAQPIRPRWGDYGAATSDGSSLWFASEYIGQTCDVATFVTTGFVCGKTRTALGNWGTRVSHVVP